jgi:hypothetical protein
MRALLIAIALLFAVAMPVSAQPSSTWDEFQAEIASFEAWLTEWVVDVNEATAPDESKALVADWIARSLEHVYRLYTTEWEDCYRDYATAYVERALWQQGYMAGYYVFLTAPPIDPIMNEPAALYSQTIAIYDLGVNKAREEVTCASSARLDPADFPLA